MPFATSLDRDPTEWCDQRTYGRIGATITPVTDGVNAERIPAGNRRGNVRGKGRSVRQGPPDRGRGAPRETAPAPAPGLGGAGSAGRARGGRGRCGRAAARRRRRRWWRAGSTTRVSRSSPGTPRAATRSRRSSPGRTSAPRRCSTRSRIPARVTERSGLPLDPYFSAGKLGWLMREDAQVASRRRGGHGAAGHGRRLALRPARQRLRHRPVDGVAHPAGHPGRAGLGPGAARSVRRAALGAARAGRQRRRARRPAPSGLADRAAAARARVDQQAALAGAGCVEPGSVKATYGTGVFVLANVGDRAPGGRRRGRAGAHRRLADRRSSRVRARRRRVHGRRAARVAVARPGPGGRPAGARGARGRGRGRRRRAACCRRWPAWARRGGAPGRTA